MTTGTTTHLGDSMPTSVSCCSADISRRPSYKRWDGYGFGRSSTSKAGALPQTYSSYYPAVLGAEYIRQELPNISVRDWNFELDGPKIQVERSGLPHERLVTFMSNRSPGRTSITSSAVSLASSLTTGRTCRRLYVTLTAPRP